MCSACLRALVLLALWLVAPAAGARELVVCADPNNLPFSNDRLEGFENRIVDIVAEELGAEVRYVWWAQRRGFFRNTLNAGLCDVVPGVPARFEATLNTAPYYRSSYVFLERADRPAVASLDDRALENLRIGVQLAGDDGANTPPVHALGRRGLVGRMVGFPLTADYAAPNPPARIVEAVAGGRVDVALVWGPLAGWFARTSAVPLSLTPIPDDSGTRMSFAIAMGVRKGDAALRDELDAALAGRRADVERALDEYGVPRLPLAAARAP